jgi:hypothetical protein
VYRRQYKYRGENKKERIRIKRRGKQNLKIKTLEGILTNNSIRWYEHILNSCGKTNKWRGLAVRLPSQNGNVLGTART